MSRYLYLAVIFVAVILLSACAQPQPPKQKVSPTLTPAHIETPAVTSKKYASLRDIAEKIRNGEIDVGNDYTMSLNGRFHRIHNKVLGLDCSTCHVGSSYAKDFLYQRKYKVPSRGAPGVVDRGVCLGCHKKGGIATPWYGAAYE